MSFIQPMLAASMPKVPIKITPGVYVYDEKFDGHRLILSKTPEGAVTAWSRDGLVRLLPPQIHEAAEYLQPGTYDGELFVPGKRSYGVTELANSAKLVYVVFDVLALLGVSTLAQTYDERRAYLAAMEEHLDFSHDAIRLAPSKALDSDRDLELALRDIWDADGEGIIIKKRTGRYYPGKRPKDVWIKMKQLRTAVLTVVGFVAGRGEIVNRGPYAMVVLRDDEGFETAVKTRNDAELERFEKEACQQGSSLDPILRHPAIGRKLRIEYQERTPDGSYRHPRWDRWEDE